MVGMVWTKLRHTEVTDSLDPQTAIELLVQWTCCWFSIVWLWPDGSHLELLGCNPRRRRWVVAGCGLTHSHDTHLSARSLLAVRPRLFPMFCLRLGHCCAPTEASNIPDSPREPEHWTTAADLRRGRFTAW